MAPRISSSALWATLYPLTAQIERPDAPGCLQHVRQRRHRRWTHDAACARGALNLSPACPLCLRTPRPQCKSKFVTRVEPESALNSGSHPSALPLIRHPETSTSVAPDATREIAADNFAAVAAMTPKDRRRRFSDCEQSRALSGGDGLCNGGFCGLDRVRGRGARGCFCSRGRGCRGAVHDSSRAQARAVHGGAGGAGGRARAGVGVAVHAVSFVCALSRRRLGRLLTGRTSRAMSREGGVGGGRAMTGSGGGRRRRRGSRAASTRARERAATVMPCVGRVGWLRFVVRFLASCGSASARAAD
jgi:hypothetical protein